MTTPDSYYQARRWCGRWAWARSVRRLPISVSLLLRILEEVCRPGKEERHQSKYPSISNSWFDCSNKTKSLFHLILGELHDGFWTRNQGDPLERRSLDPLHQPCEKRICWPAGFHQVNKDKCCASVAIYRFWSLSVDTHYPEAPFRGSSAN